MDEDLEIVCGECSLVFDGTTRKAEKIGWVEAEYGWLCPKCEDGAVPVGASASADTGSILDQLATDALYPDLDANERATILNDLRQQRNQE